jgi:hypothetical protein
MRPPGLEVTPDTDSRPYYQTFMDANELSDAAKARCIDANPKAVEFA